MTIVENSLPSPAKEAEQASPQLESAWRLIVVAVGWVLLATAGSAVMGVFVGVLKAAFHLQKTPTFELLAFTLYVSAFGAVLLSAAIIRGRIIGRGDVRLGLSIAPISKLPIVIVLAILVAAYAALLDYAAYTTHPDVFFQFSSVSPRVVLLRTFALVLMAPLAEELFFRGWLWNGLRQRWNALPTALFTAAFWLVLHLDRGLSLVALLLPVALVLTLARQVGKSVWATIPLHGIYNLASNFPLIVIVLALHQPKASTLLPASIDTPATVVSKEVFAGREARIAAMNYVNTDCSSGPVPDVRIVTSPANGSIRLAQITIPIDRPKSDERFACNGKPVEAMGIFYTSRDGFAGGDTVMLDVDFRHGTVRRITYKISVR
jgi:membrane protease YdiL (CAAX protease family)